MNKRTERSKRLKQQRIDAGVCTRCGKRPFEDGKQKCEECQGKQAGYDKKYNNDETPAQKARRRSRQNEYRVRKGQERVTQGMCGRCGKEPFLSHLFNRRSAANTFCETCSFKRRALQRCGSTDYWHILKVKWELQGGRCAYTGKKLFLGINASVDHVLPLCRFPDQEVTIDALEWTTMRVNEFKGGKTKDEFLAAIQEIGDHLDLGFTVSQKSKDDESVRAETRSHWKRKRKAVTK